jgi:predicted ribosomally synthesized peptide with SipW-like signal peptide
MRTRKIALMAAVAALALLLVGAGLRAAFTDSATATQNVSVGTFGIELSSDTPGAVVVDDHTITFTADKIMSSAPGQAPFSFTVTSTGSIPVVIGVSATPLSAPFSDLLGPVTDVPLVEGGSTTFDGGIAWTELGNDEIGDAVSITYTITANEAP